MVDLAMVLLGLFSVSIFLAHAIQAYRAQEDRGPRAPPRHSADAFALGDHNDESRHRLVHAMMTVTFAAIILLAAQVFTEYRNRSEATASLAWNAVVMPQSRIAER